MRIFPAAHVVFLGFPREAPLQGVALRRTMSGRDPALLPLLCWWLSRAQGMLRPGTLDMWEALGPGTPGNMGPRPKNESNGVEMCGRGRIIELVWLILRFSTLPSIAHFSKMKSWKMRWILVISSSWSPSIWRIDVGSRPSPKPRACGDSGLGFLLKFPGFPEKREYTICPAISTHSVPMKLYIYIFINYVKHLPSWTKLHPLISWRIIPLRNWTSKPGDHKVPSHGLSHM